MEDGCLWPGTIFSRNTQSLPSRSRFSSAIFGISSNHELVSKGFTQAVYVSYFRNILFRFLSKVLRADIVVIVSLNDTSLMRSPNRHFRLWFSFLDRLDHLPIPRHGASQPHHIINPAEGRSQRSESRSFEIWKGPFSSRWVTGSWNDRDRRVTWKSQSSRATKTNGSGPLKDYRWMEVFGSNGETFIKRLIHACRGLRLTTFHVKMVHEAYSIFI